jgi:membrane fusion protein (multidrug efflux system)
MDVQFAVPSVELFSMRDMEARGSARSYGQGSPAELRLLEGVEYGAQGKVVFLDTQVEAATSAVRAKARFPNPQGQLLPGQFVAVRVGGASLVDAIMIPQEALVRTEQGMGVYVVDAANRVTLTPVGIGPAFGGNFLVEKGLEAGQRIVVQGQDKISTGRTVTPVPLRQDLVHDALDADPGTEPSPTGGVDGAPAPLRSPAQETERGASPHEDRVQPSNAASGKGGRP